MDIGIDGNEANLEKMVGVNQYAFNLLWNLYKLQGDLKSKNIFTVYLSKPPRSSLPKETGFWKYRVLPGKGFWIIKKLMPALYKTGRKHNVFFTPSHYVPPFCPIPRVMAIMDLGYLEYTDQFNRYDFWQLKLWTAWSITVSKSIIAISATTKKDIVRHYPFAQKKVNVTTLGYDKDLYNPKIASKNVRRVKDKYSIVGNYILFLSTLKPSKNIEGLLASWKQIEQEFPETVLVIAGKKGWMFENIFSRVRELGIVNRVIFTDFVLEEDKPALITGAKALVFPSFMEGFGLVPLESMACGVPVIISNRGSLPEVAGKAGVYVNPENHSNIAAGIKKVLEMPQVDYNKLVRKGLAQANTFSWVKTARETMKVLEEAAQ